MKWLVENIEKGAAVDFNYFFDHDCDFTMLDEMGVLDDSLEDLFEVQLKI